MYSISTYYDFFKNPVIFNLFLNLSYSFHKHKLYSNIKDLTGTCTQTNAKMLKCKNKLYPFEINAKHNIKVNAKKL